MSGFFVSNSLGTFNAEGKTKAFNASLSGFPGAPSSATFRGLMEGLPLINNQKPSIWAYNDFHLTHGGKTVTTGKSNKEHDKFFKWNNGSTAQDKVILYKDDAFSFTAKPGTTSKFTVKYVTNDKGTKNAYDYVVNIKKETISIPTAAISSNSKYSCFSNYYRDDKTGVCQFDVTLDGDDASYMSVDMNQNSSDAANSRYNTACGKWSKTNASGSDDPYNNDIDYVMIIWLSTTKNPVPGCIDTVADNYDSKASKDNGTCRYTTSGITKFAVTPNEVKTGENINISWNLANSNFSSIKCLMNGTDIMPSGKRSSKTQNFNYVSTSEGTKNFELIVNWNKAGTSGNVKSSKKSVNVVSPITYIPCTDPNRATDSNGECASCNTNYYLDDATGLCSQCQDPNRNQATDGKCTDCMSGYAEHTDGSCQKVGCMTYADGSSAADDYEYDPDAVVNDSTMCQGKEEDDDPDINPVLESIDCELSDWADWSDYSDWSDAATESGTRTRTRSRTIVTNVQANGAICGALEETETETGELDPDTGEVTITTQTTGSTATTTETSSPVVPILIGVAALGALALLIRR